MPDTHEAQQAIKQLKLAYISALIIIVLLLISAQALIQLALREEQQTRASALLVGTQALRLQALELEALNLADKNQDVTQNVLLFSATERVWEQVHTQMLALPLSSDEKAKIQAVQPIYQAIRTGARSLVTLEATPKSVASFSKAEKAAFTKAFLAIFYNEPIDLRALVYVTQSLNFESDTYVVQIKIVELILFGLSLLTLLAEYLFVIRPANNRLQIQVQVKEIPSPN